VGTEPPQSTDPGASHSWAIARDSAFARVYVDNIIAVFLGRDVEMAMLAATPSVLQIVPEDEPGKSEVTLTPNTVEVCRARMAPGTALNACFNTLLALLQNDELDVDELRSNIERMISIAESDSKGTDAG
jgi:hypothetical protein